MATQENPTQSFMSRAGPLVIARLFTAGLTVCIPFVLARAMSLAEFGTYKQLFLIAMTLYLVMPFGVTQSLYFFIPRADKKRPFMGQTLGYMIMAGALAGAGIYLLAGKVGHFFQNDELVHYRASLAVYTFGLIASYPLEIGLTSQGKTRGSAACYLGSDILRAALMTVPILLGFGLAGIMWAIASLYVLRTLATWIVLLSSTEGPLFDPTLARQQLRYAAPYGAAMLLSVPQQYLHQYAVSAMVAPALYAIYTVGCFQLPVVDLLYTPTSEVLMVQLGELDKAGRMAEAVNAFRSAATRLALFFLPLSAFLFAVAPEFIGALFGAKFMAAVPLFRISVIGVALTIFPMDGVLRARGQTRHIFFSYLVKALVTVPLVYFGVKRFGMIGGISSYALAELVGKFMLMVRVPHALAAPEQKLSYADVIPFREIGRMLLAALGSAACIMVVKRFAAVAVGTPQTFIHRVIPLGLGGLLFVVGYLALLQLLGAQPLAALARLRRPRRVVANN